MLLTITQILSLITSWLFPISIFVVIAGVVVDLLKKRFYWSKFALIFFVITVILLVIQIKLIYRITGDILNNSSNETTNWKTYTNKKHNYSLQYPQDWEIEWLAGDEGSTIDDADLIELSSNTEQEYTFEVVSLRSNVFNSSNIEEFSKQLDKFGWRGNPIVSKEKTTLGGVEALRYTTKEVIAVRVIKPIAEDKIYIYDVSLQGENPKLQTIKVLNTIKATFKFI